MYIRDTIAAISTSPGNGSISIIRVSGDLAESIGKILFKPVKNGGFESHRFYFGTVVDVDSHRLVDEVMVVLMRSPRSYTREDILELHCHGGYFVTEQILSLVLRCGARLANPGEFTCRAFLNGRIDLVQAEAVMDIINSKTKEALYLAQCHREGILSKRIESVRQMLIQALALVEAYIDFPDEDLGALDIIALCSTVDDAQSVVHELLSSFDEGRILRDGVSVLIIGKPNVGKSSLLNCLLNENRAIVTHVPGTTRDIIEETINIEGLQVRLIDTAGIRHSEDLVEQAGIDRALENIAIADLVLHLMDLSRVLECEDRIILDAVRDKNVILVLNKADLPIVLELSDEYSVFKQVSISANTGTGIIKLKELIRSTFLHDSTQNSTVYASISRSRHRDALAAADHFLSRCRNNIASSNLLELIALDLRESLYAIGSVTGVTYVDEVLERVFSSFCIGK